MSQATVNGKKQDIIITNNFMNSEFYKLNKKLPYSVLEYLFINQYEYSEIKRYFDHNDNIIMNFHNTDNVSEDGELKVLSKFKIDGDTLENLNPSNTKDCTFKLNLEKLKFNSQTIKRSKYPFYAIITLKKCGEIFEVIEIDFLEAITIDIEEYIALRKKYTSQDWLNLIFSTIGYDADTLTPFEKHSFLVRLIPFCIEQYHIIELGNKETAKSYFYSVMSDIIHSSSISAGSITMAKLVRNNSTNEPGMLSNKSVINFDEIPDTYWKDKDIVTTLQTYLQDGLANRDDGIIAGKASLVFTGNLNDFESSALKKDSLFNHFKAEIRNETIIDKLYFFSPGWKFTKINPNKYVKTNFPRIRRDYFLCALNLMRENSKDYIDIFENTINFVETDSGRDMRAVATIAGLIMLLHPDIDSMSIEELEAFAYIALIGRKALLRELEIKNKGQHKNTLEVKNIEINKKIKFEELSNFIINTSETLLNSHNIYLDNIEYYYLDYYKDYDATEKINTQYDFELIEPTIVIKCFNNPNIYKLAVSSYGINMNILEINESKAKNNIICNNLTENFMLIETNKIKTNVVKLHLKKFTKSSISSLEELKENLKDQVYIGNLIDILIEEQKKQPIFYNAVKNLENKISILNNKITDSQEIIIKMDSIIKIKDIVNLTLSSNIKTLNELYNLRKILLDEVNETLTGKTTQGGFKKYNLGEKIYINHNGQYRLAYKEENNVVILKGIEYIKTKKFEPLDQENKESERTIISNKDEAINNQLENFIKLIDNILNYIKDNDFIEINTISHSKDSLENQNVIIKNLNSNISNIDLLIKNFSSIEILMKNLRTESNFSTIEIINYSNFLKELVKITESYITTYAAVNNQETNTLSISDNLDQSPFNETYLKKTIFDNEFISNLKNTQN